MSEIKEGFKIIKIFAILIDDKEETESDQPRINNKLKKNKSSFSIYHFEPLRKSNYIPTLSE